MFEERLISCWPPVGKLLLLRLTAVAADGGGLLLLLPLWYGLRAA
jgi:hypothetical protein